MCHLCLNFLVLSYEGKQSFGWITYRDHLEDLDRDGKIIL